MQCVWPGRQFRVIVVSLHKKQICILGYLQYMNKGVIASYFTHTYQCAPEAFAQSTHCLVQLCSQACRAAPGGPEH